MLNRTIQPELQSIDKIDFVKPTIYDITSEVKLFFMKDVTNETTRFDLYFDAGNIRSPKGIPAFVNGLLLSGTNEKSSTQINNDIDALGGFMESGLSAENAIVSMYCLRENVLPILHILTDAIDNVAFLESEVTELLADKKQAFFTNMEKVSYLCQREFQKRLFHSSEVYSTVATEDFYENVSIQGLKKFFQQYYQNGLSKVVVVGNLEQDTIDEIIDLVGKWAKTRNSEFEKNIKNLPGEFHVEKENAVQTAIRVGKILFNKNHEDYNDFLVLNTILGDYFGSRLMANIREDKGYTYGIGSMVAEYNNIGYFMIATEVGKEVKDATLKEIQFEIERLKTELIDNEELDLIKNYLLGQLLKSADGPYSMMDLFLSAEAQGLDFNFYNKAIEELHSITPERIQELAIKYLIWEEMTVVSAG
jgi:zinc protease